MFTQIETEKETNEQADARDNFLLIIYLKITLISILYVF